MQDLTVAQFNNAWDGNNAYARGFIEGMAIGMKAMNQLAFCPPGNVTLDANLLFRLMDTELRSAQERQGQIDLSQLTVNVLLLKTLQDQYPGA